MASCYIVKKDVVGATMPRTRDAAILKQPLESGTRPRVVAADDHSAVLDQIALELGNEIELVARVGDGPAAVEAAEKLRPDLVIVDISMPLGNGIDAARELRRHGSQAKVIFLSIHEHADYVEAAFSAGARGYVAKACMHSDLLPAIREVLAGRTFISSTIDYDFTPL